MCTWLSAVVRLTNACTFAVFVGLALNDAADPPQHRVFAAAVVGSTMVLLVAVLVVVLLAS
jgi:hypothetical protein